MRTPMTEIVKIAGLMLLLSVMPLLGHAAPSVVGKVNFARGSVAAQQKGQAPRILGKDSEIYQGDNIQTAERSFVIVDFNDGAKVTVRPGSNFSIDQYELQAQKAQLTLHEGGVRAASGQIAKQDADSFAIKTELGTVTAQDADYSVRVCQQDCDDNDSSAQTTPNNAVARIVDLKGQVFAKNRADSNTNERPLSLGSPLFDKDYLRSTADSYALMVFRDGEKITLQANSELDIADYHFKEAGTKDHALYRLTTGGLRALTGSIGKTDKSAYAIETPVGTIGIRGTGFDLSCVGDCLGDANRPARPTQNFSELPEGLYTQVWQGQIALRNDAGEHLLTVPKSNYIANRQSVALELPYLPETLFNNLTPRPDINAMKNKAAGLFVAVNKGRARVDGKAGTGAKAKLELASGEVGRIGHDKHAERVNRSTSFVTKDPYLTADDLALHPVANDTDSPFTNDAKGASCLVAD